MIVNEDGGVTGSIDVSKLDEIDAKSDEAKAQVAQLKAERDASNAQAEKDAALASQGERAPGGLQDPARESGGQVREGSADESDGDAKKAAAKKAADDEAVADAKAKADADAKAAADAKSGQPKAR